MIKSRQLLCYCPLSVVLCVLASCATTVGQRENWPAPPPPPASTPLPGTPGPATPLPTPPKPIIPQPRPEPSYPRAAEEISGQAVTSLVQQARTDRASGRLDQAASNLERALRIEPRNYFVWSALASVYLDQKQFDQADTVAQRSNSLARGNLYVELENWKTIAAARQGQGDAVGALQAQSRADELQRQLRGG